MAITSELQLQAACFQWYWNEFRFTKWKMCLHMNNNNSGTGREGLKNKALGVVPGASDMEFVGFCRMYFIELKFGLYWKQSDEQKEFQKMCEDMGHIYIIIEDLETFKNYIWELIITGSE